MLSNRPCRGVLAICLGVVAAAQVAASSMRVELRMLAAQADVQDCHVSSSSQECIGKESCSWCRSSILPSGCYHSAEVNLLPSSMFTCKGGAGKRPLAWGPPTPWAPPTPADSGGGAADSPPAPYAPGPTPGGGCMTHKDKHECKKDGANQCVWCTGGYMPAQCMPESQSKYIPGLKCTKVKPPHEDDDADTQDAVSRNDPSQQEDGAPHVKPELASGPAPSCSDFTKEKKCLKHDCAWCENQYGPAACYDDAQAKHLPPSIFKCKPAPSARVV